MLFHSVRIVIFMEEFYAAYSHVCRENLQSISTIPVLLLSSFSLAFPKDNICQAKFIKLKRTLQPTM